MESPMMAENSRVSAKSTMAPAITYVIFNVNGVNPVD
jgi:hypothetical protein